MDKISKDHFIAGAIGGVTALLMAMAVKRFLWRRRGGKCGGKWRRPEATIVTMESENLPKAIGPYSKGKMVDFGNGSYMAWSAGQLGLDPKTGELISPDVEAQAEQVLLNLKNLAQDNGFDLEKHTVKNVVYLVDMNDFAKVNEIYKKYYPTDYPARTCIAIKGLPKGGLVEIESVFFKGKTHHKQE